MAEYSENYIRIKTFLLMAVGAPYGKPDSRKSMVLDRHGDTTHRQNGHFDAFGFDIGSIRCSFSTHEEARDRLKDFQSGKLKINEHRQIDPQNIRIHEMIYEARAIDFSDNEHEIMSVIGALDTMSPEQAKVVKASYPDLVDTQIKYPSYVAYDTYNGNDPNSAFTAFIRCSPQAREIFNKIAGDLKDKVEALPAQTVRGMSFAEFVNNHFYGCSFYRGLRDVAEEIGKEKIGINVLGLTEAMELRLYDYRETHKRESTIPIRAKENALSIIAQAHPAAARALLQAMEARRINPFPR